MRKTRKISGLLGTVALILVAGCSSAPTEFTTHGKLDFIATTLEGMDFPGWNMETAPTAGMACQGKNGSGYDDLTGGAQVKVTDASGKTLALGQLDTGTYTPNPGYPVGDMAVIAGTCTFNFTVANTPAAGIYGVTLGQRPGPQFTEPQMQAGPALTIGTPPH